MVATVPFTPLDRISSAERPLSGGKAYNCARLKQAGFPVPDGLVVLSTASDADLAALTAHPWFDGLPADATFAVRSSSIGEDGEGESFAGIHQTLLNVPRAGVPAAVADCRRSGGSPQAIEYRRAKGLSLDDIAMGVLIQRMVQPVTAGVAFTVNPVTGATGEIVVNSSWGLGEALVSGQVDPDEFVVAKDDGELRWTRIGDKTGDRASSMASLSTEQIRALALVLTRVEQHYGAPQDVEWCYDGTAFWLVQSRPITTDVAAASEIEWTRANLAEVLPDLTSPQALRAFEDLLNRAERKYMGALIAPASELGPMVKSFHGRLFFNLTQVRRICQLGGVAPALMLRSMGHAGAIRPEDEQAPRPAVGELLSCAPDLLRILWRHLRAAHIVAEHESRVGRYLTRLAAMDPRTLADDRVWSVLDEWLRESPDVMQPVLLLSGVLFHEMPVRKLCDRVGYPFERLVYPQLAAGERSVSAQQAFDLVALARRARRDPAVVEFLAREGAELPTMREALRGTKFMAAFERFLRRYGHRGLYESDWSLPRYSEDPTPLVRALRAHLDSESDHSLSEIELRQTRESADAWAGFTRRLSRWQRWTALPRVRRAIRRIKQYYLWREQVRSDMVRVLAAVRVWHLVLADRFVERGWLDARDDYFLLQLDEIEHVVKGVWGPDQLRPIARDRRLALDRHRLVRLPLLMRESELPRLIRTAGVSGERDETGTLSGHPVSGGCVEAEVVVIRDPADFGRMRPGAILVAPAADPSWTPLFTLASGVIVEVGGVLSHASTIAREYGLPALANVRHATRLLRSGERVRLDANQGVVCRLERSAADVAAQDTVWVA